MQKALSLFSLYTVYAYCSSARYRAVLLRRNNLKKRVNSAKIIALSRITTTETVNENFVNEQKSSFALDFSNTLLLHH
jgi:hypothetical protein